MSAIMGQDLLIFTGMGSAAKVIAAGTSCSFNPTAQEIEIASKDNSDYSEYVMGRKSWTMSSDHILNDGAYEELFEAWQGRTLLDVEFKANPNATGTASAMVFKGKAYVSELPLTAPDQAAATFSVTFRGTGAIANPKPARSSK